MSTPVKVILWVLTVLFILFGFVTIPYPAAALFFLAALILLPIQRWRELTKKLFPKKWIRPMLVVLLFFLALLLLPPDFGKEEDLPVETPAVETTLPPTRRPADAIRPEE